MSAGPLTLFRHLPVVLVTPDGTIVDATAAAQRSFAHAGTLQGKSWCDVCIGPPERTRDYLALCSRTLDPVPGSFQVLVDGAEARFRCDGYAAVLADGSKCIVLQFRGQERNDEFIMLGQKIEELNGEILRRKALERETRAARIEAEAASRAKDDFLAMLGHELRNPLAPILTALQLMKLRGNDAVKRERDVIERQVRHVSRLVDDLLDVSRITRGKVSLDKEPVELSVAISKAIEIAEPLMEERAHRLQVNVPDHGLVVDADPVRLSQIVANLLSNAARYTMPGGRIEVTSRREGVDAVIDVIDNGVGISAELLPRVFDLFVQGERAIDRSEGGLGLGLALVDNLVRMHGGAVSAHSEGPGRGSRFTVRLPAIERTREEAREVAELPAYGAALESRQPRRILIVDDNADAAETMAEMLKMLGHTVVVAYDGPQGLLALESFNADVALLDIGLPVMDGYELARRIRDGRAEQPPRLIAMTGYGQAEDRAHSRSAGFDEHLVKPVSIESVIAAIEALPTSDPTSALE
jgi:signal transduction histidine kinase/ActR/RegA family two-component response regulator